MKKQGRILQICCFPKVNIRKRSKKLTKRQNGFLFLDQAIWCMQKKGKTTPNQRGIFGALQNKAEP
jgi:hypothetical protein